MLAIQLRYLTGRCVATAYSNRFEPEWPPHPARFFSALVATWAHADDTEPDREERSVLKWFETLPAPHIVASDAWVREVVQVYVPVNDVSVLSPPDPRPLNEARTNLAEAEALLARPDLTAAARKDTDKQRAKIAKELDKLEKRYLAALAKDIAPGKVSDSAIKSAVAVQPESRTRQPRTFPSVTPVDPRVVFMWPEVTPSEAQLAVLDRLLARIVRLGHSSSLVSASLCRAAQTARWRPHDEGELVLRIVQPGQLDALVEHHAQHREIEPRVMPARFQRYTERPATVESAMVRSVFGEDWIVLRRVSGPSLPMAAGPGVARTLRRALLAWADRAGVPISEALSGHKPDRSPSEDDHVAFVPLPFVGHARATGDLLGVALVLPRALSHVARRQVFAPLAAWEDAERLDDEDTPELTLTLGQAGQWRIERLDERAAQSTLRSDTWCRPSRAWVSATPVALDRNPGDLSSRDPDKLAGAVANAVESVSQACVRIGLPRPTEVAILPAAPLSGGAKAHAFQPFPSEQGKLRRVLTHARLVFGEDVRGPLLIGAGRYLGLGLFRPEGGHD